MMRAQREVLNIAGSVLFLGLGFLGIWLARAWFGLSGEALFISLLVIPIVIFLAYSGRLVGLKGPGGLEASFASVAQQSVEEAARTEPISVEAAQAITKGAVSSLDNQLRNVDQSKFLMLRLNTGRRTYTVPDLKTYLETLSQYRHFKLVVILNKDDRFVAQVPPATLRQMLESGALGLQFIDDIDNGRDTALLRYPGVLGDATVYTTDTNLDALKKMAERNLEALVVIDKERRVLGVLGRELVLTKLMVALAG